MGVYEDKLLAQVSESKKCVSSEHLDCNGFAIQEMESLDPEDSYFSQDIYNMVQSLGSNILAMFSNNEKEDMKYLILVERETGRRIKIYMPGFTK